MANEAVIVELLGDGGDPIDFIIPDTPGIAKGSVLWFGDARLASGASTNTGAPFAGINLEEKKSGDGSLRISCYTHCIADLMTTSIAVTAGSQVVLSGVNTIRDAAATDSDNGFTIGKALETGASNSRCEVLIGAG